MSNAPEIVASHKGAYRVVVGADTYTVDYDSATALEKAFVNAAYDYQGSIDTLIGKINSVKDSADYALELLSRGSDVNSLGVFHSTSTLADVYAGVVYEKKNTLAVFASLVDDEREAAAEGK